MTHNLPASQTGFSALSPQQQQEHRAKIGVRVQAILSGFWKEADTPDAVKAIELEIWMDALQSLSHSEIRFAYQAYMDDPKNRSQNNRLVKPDPVALKNIALKKRPKSREVHRFETAEEREANRIKLENMRAVDPEKAKKAAEILKASGFNLRVQRND